MLAHQFMQRGTASSPSSAASTPSGPPSKRKRLDYAISAPATPSTPSEFDELHQQSVIEKQAADAGESRWVLNVKDVQPVVSSGFNIVQASWADIDSTRDVDEGEIFDDDTQDFTGRKRFGKPPVKPDTPIIGRKRTHKASSLDSNESGSEDDSDQVYDPTEELIKQERRAAAAKAREGRNPSGPSARDGKESRDTRYHREMSIRGPEAISGGQRKISQYPIP